MSFRRSLDITGHAGAIYTCDWDNQYIYTGSADKYVARWNLQSGQQDKFAIKFEHAIYRLRLIENRFLLVGLANGDLHVFDLNERKEIHYFVQHKSAIFSIQHNREKKQVYVADASGNLSIWNSETFEQLIYLPLDTGKVREIAVSTSGEHFCLTCQDGTLRVFETGFFNEILTVDAHKDGATAAIFVSEKELITGGKDAHLRRWDLTTGNELQSIPAHNFAIYRLMQLNDQVIISISRDKTIKAWSNDLDIIERIDFKKGGHQHSVNDLVRLSDASFATVSDDKRIKVWTLD